MSVVAVLGLLMSVQAALPEGNTGLAAKYPGDKGIDRDPNVIFSDNFEVGMPTDRWSMTFQIENVRMASEPANVHSGKRALEFTLPKKSAEGSNAAMKRFDKGYDAVFLRYYSRFDPEWDQLGSSHNGGYLAALSDGLPYATPGVKADGKNKFVASFENWRDDPAKSSPGELNVYIYHPEQRTDYGDHFFPTGIVLPYTYKLGDYGPSFVKRNDITPKLGQWYCFELMMKANTPGKRDGRIGCWVDGKLIADFPNLRLRDVDTLKINHAAIDMHIKDNAIRTNKKWYDDVVIATSYVGPMVK